MAWPQPVIPPEHHLTLAQIVAATSWLPNRATVAQYPVAVFPTVRKKSDAQIGTPFLVNGTTVGMYDNNTTPKLALGWTHDLVGKTTKWTIAHVWPSSEDVTAYTHLANLALVPEALDSTTDKDGPLTAYLRWHAHEVYQWHPQCFPEPQRPADYDHVVWRYLTPIPNPRALVLANLNASRNRSLVYLREIMHQLNHPTLLGEPQQ